MKRADFSDGYKLEPVKELPNIFRSTYREIVEEFLSTKENICEVKCSKSTSALYSGFNKAITASGYTNSVALTQRQNRIFLVKI
jgi:hypothetical protein